MSRSQEPRSRRSRAPDKTANTNSVSDGDRLQDLRASADEAAALLRAMASSHRLMILCALVVRPMTVTELCEVLDARQSLVSQHLIRLRQDRLVVAERRGQFVHYSLKGEVSSEILEVLQRHYCPGVGGLSMRN